MDYRHSTASDQGQSKQTGNLNRGVQIGIVTVDGNGNIRSGDAVYYQEKTTIQKQLERYSEDNYGSSLGAQLVKAADIYALADGYAAVASELAISLGFNESLRGDVATLKAKLHEALKALGEAEDRERGMRSIEIESIRIDEGEYRATSTNGDVVKFMCGANVTLKPRTGDRIAIIPKAVDPVISCGSVASVAKAANGGYGYKLPEPIKQPWEHARDQVLTVWPEARMTFTADNMWRIETTKALGSGQKSEGEVWITARDMLADIGKLAS